MIRYFFAMSKQVRGLAFLTITLLIPLTSGPAVANGKALATGEEAYYQGKFIEARSSLMASLGTLPAGEEKAKAYILLGMVELAEGNVDAAEERFGQAVEETPKATLSTTMYPPQVVKLYDKARARSIGAVYIHTTPSDAEVFIDNQRVGLTPVAVDDLLIGVHAIRLEKSGYRFEEREITVRESERSEFYLDLSVADEIPPAIESDPVTVAIEGRSFRVRAKVTDDQGITTVSLHYRKSGDLDYTTVRMGQIDRDLFEGVPPRNDVTAAGLEYYLEAIDFGGNVTTEPDADTPILTRVTEVDREAPHIFHTPLLATSDATEQIIKATVKDNKGVGVVRIFYKKEGDGQYIEEAMVDASGGGDYQTIMPNQFFTARRIYYYLEAVDLSGNLQSDGTAETPHEVIVYLVQPYKDGYVVDRKKRSNGDYEREATVNVGTLKGYKKGQVFTVFTADERVVDPESGMVLAIRQKVTGKVEITKAGPASSTVRITDEEDRNVPIEAGQLIRFRPGPPRNVGGRSEKYQENIVTWDVASEPEVRGYYVYRSDSPDGPFEEFDQIRSRSRAEAKDKGGKKSKLVEGERYYYKVVSFNDEKELSDYSAIGSVVAKGGPNPPTSVTAISGEIQKISLFWTPTDDNEAVGYKIQRAATQEGPYIDIAELKSNRADEYSDKPRDSQNHPLDDATSYWYQIVSYNRSGKIGNPTEPVMAVSRRKPTAPEQLAVVSSSVRSITLTWEPAADQDVERYRIYRSASTAGPWTPIKEIRDRNEGEFADEDRSGHDLQDGATYYYRIASVNEGGVESPLSEPVSGTTFGPPAGPTDVFALSGQVRQVTVTWGLSTDPSVAGYAIYRGNSSDSLEKVKSITQGNVTSYVDKGDWSTRLEDGRSYFYAIRSVNGVGVESVEPKVIEAMTKPGPNPPPNVTATQHEAGRTTISWDNQPSAGIESYRVLRSDNPDADYRTVAPAVKQVTFTDSGLKNGALYYYKVQALDKDGLLGSLSRVVTAQTKAAPTMPEGITSSPDGGAVILTWTASSAPDIDKYEIYQISFFGKKKLGETSDATFTVTGLSSGSTNTFTIVAIDREGLISEPSAPIEVLAP